MANTGVPASQLIGCGLSKSLSAYERAASVFPGATTRATIARDPQPIYVDRGEGPWLVDIDGNRYLDFNNNFTTLVHGHAFPPAMQAIALQLEKGTCFANPTLSEIELAELLCDRVPCIDQIRFVNTGTEAVMFAIKAARAYTGKSKVAKLEGAYHGGYDWAEVSENSSPQNWGKQGPASVPYYKGTPDSVLREVVVLPMNDIDQTHKILKANSVDLSCVLIDLMPSRAGLVPLSPAYVNLLREFTEEHGIVLISDEVLNFRQDFQGASSLFGLTPDLVTLGKIIGGGLPIGAVGGSANQMAVFDNCGRQPELPQAGTFSANPLSMVAGKASMDALNQVAFDHLESIGLHLRTGISAAFDKYQVPMCVSGQASLFRIHAMPRPPSNYREAYGNTERNELMRAFCQSLLRSGVNLPIHGTGSLSTCMGVAEIELAIAAVAEFSSEWKSNNS